MTSPAPDPDADDSAARSPAGPRGVVRARLWRLLLTGTAAFALTAFAALADVTALRAAALVVALVLFAVGCVLFLWAYSVAVGRSRTDELSVVGVYLLSGCVPGRERLRVLGLVAAQIAVALVTASLRPYTTLAFGILVPMFGLGVAGMWGARLGTFPPRTTVAPATRGRSVS